ncbi:MAG TPA: hypothetical protein PK974_04300 [Rhodocyclaceae bacterium]|nr:hypothetical protein [Rhodocyclaceae bacterium]
MRVLLLCNYDLLNAATVCDHINSFPLYSTHEVVVHSWLVKNGGELGDDFPLDVFDAVVLHYSLFLSVDAYVAPSTRKRLESFKGVKAIFLQDEYRFINASIKSICDVGFDIIFTCVPENAVEQVYPAAKLPGVERVNVLTGYVPAALLHYQPVELDKRSTDVSYRGRRYPAWHGRLGLEKWTIAERFSADAKCFDLKCDISYLESDRLYGGAWVDLLQRSKAVLGVESGASVFDFTGEISGKVDTIEKLLGDKAKYEKLRQDYFADIEDSISLAQISPRIFEAIALRTLCILYEGEYSGVLKPWRHYVPLKKDHSNMAEVVDVLRDPQKMAEIIANAYAEVALNPEYSYKAFIEKVDDFLLRRHDISKSKKSVCGFDQPVKGTEATLTTSALQAQVPFDFTPNPHILQLRYGSALKLRSVLLPYLPQRFKNLIKALIRH